MSECKGKIFINGHKGYITNGSWFEDNKIYKFIALFNTKDGEELFNYPCNKYVNFIYEEKKINSNLAFNNSDGGFKTGNNYYLHITLYKNK